MIISGIWGSYFMCSASIWSLLWYRRIFSISFFSELPTIQLDWWEPLFYKRQQWELEYWSWWWKIWSLVRWWFEPGSLWTVPDLRQRSINAECRFRRQDSGMLGVYIKHNIVCFYSRVMITADVICWRFFFIVFFFLRYLGMIVDDFNLVWSASIYFCIWYWR